ncbi:MAG: hypothetical protein MK207_03535 [Saprospiraceae bacterium]|nr:hypothetical protein [Saprospiraceae bacterium]
MEVIKKSSCLLTIVVGFSFLLTSCGAGHHVGCPGQDRPSFKSAYSTSTSSTYEFYVLDSDKKSNAVF